MSYIKQTFLNEVRDENGNVIQEGTTLTAEHLNHMEDGLAAVVCTTANALTGNASGEVISLDDVSPLKHTLEVKAQSKNLIDPKQMVVTNPANNTEAYFTENADGSFTLTKNGTCGYKTKNFSVNIPAGTTVIASATIEGTAECLLMLVYKDGTNRGGVFGYPVTAIKDITAVFIYTLYETPSGTSVTLSDIQLEIGTEKTSYTPYVDVSQTKVMAFGKNLIPYPFPLFRVASENKRGEITAEDMGDGGIRLNSANGQPTTETVYVDISDIFISPFGIGPVANKGFIASKTDNANVSVWYNSGVKTTFIRIEPNTLLSNYIVYPQIEKGTVSTAFEKGKPYTEYIPLADGTVGVESISPNMTLISDIKNVLLDAQYNKDTNKVIEKLINRIAALESAVI